jgi:hypothetical protein
MRVAARLAVLVAAVAYSDSSNFARAVDAGTTATATRPNTVLLMTHRRDAGVRAVLDHLAAFSASPSSLRVVVAQSAELRRRGRGDSVPAEGGGDGGSPHSDGGSEEGALAWIGVGEEGGPTHPDPYVSATASVLASYASTFGRVEHVVAPYVRGDGSYSRDARAFGTKRNALVNLLTGLTAAFGPGGLQRQGIPVNASWNSGGGEGTDAGGAAADEEEEQDPTGEGTGGAAAADMRKPSTAADGSRDGLRRARSAAASEVKEGDAVEGTRSSPPPPAAPTTSPSPPRRSFLTVPTEVLILEDDAVLSPDALEYFDSASRLMDLDRHLDFATSSVQFRPNLVIGHADTDLITALRGRTPESTEVLIDRISGTPRTVFKTFACMGSRRGWAGLRGLLEGMARASLPVPPSPPQSAPVPAADAAATPPPPSSSVAVAWRSVHPELVGCVWCNDYCYDHLVEWFLQGSPFLAPAVARATQAAGRGMTYAENAVDAIHAGRARRSKEFVTGWASMALVRFFPSPGLSSMAPMRPTAAAAAAADVDTAAAAAAAAGEPHLARSELILLVITEPLVTFLLLLLSVLSVFVAVSLASCVQARLAARKTIKAH